MSEECDSRSIGERLADDYAMDHGVFVFEENGISLKKLTREECAQRRAEMKQSIKEQDEQRKADRLRLDATMDVPLDRLRELCAAERDGKLWIMPCKRGDTVYRFVGAKGRKRVEPREVMSVTKYGTTVTVYTTTEDVLGKTVFLTKPEAIAALSASAGKE